MFSYAKRYLKYFVENCSIHGVRYLGERCNVPAKLFWLSMIVCSFTAMGYILLYTLENYEETVNINIDTSYLRWNHTFPAFSICYLKGSAMVPISKFLEEFWEATNITKPSKLLGYQRLAHSYTFISSSASVVGKHGMCTGRNSTCDLNLEVLRQLFVPQDCTKVFEDVKYLGISYPCEKFFRLFGTEMGLCFVANSIYSYNMKYENLPLKYTARDERRIFEFKYKDIDVLSYTLYLHSPDELPYASMYNEMLRKAGAAIYVPVDTMEVYNKPDIRDQPMAQRECRFPFENITNYLPYSFTNCALVTRIETEFEMCNCTNPAFPKEYSSRYCNFEGLACIFQDEVSFRTKQKLIRDKTCIKSCLEMEINLLGISIDEMKNNSEFGHVVLEVLNLPTSRYERSVARTSLDFIVSLGGVGGLFFGISLLSIVEIVYFCLRSTKG
ncbi:sodium channel protein Nach isoform X2 [Uranotaenia lowii]|uniref:sodium channel protein Nach isoform X2 n=1 Tax=Uranotaenia lowii TaxID=190385 RepID=UPI00247A1B94|nr:sodium channel protein Nach isoform X2 [Uranotaenia lowii]